MLNLLLQVGFDNERALAKVEENESMSGSRSFEGVDRKTLQ
jgi:hypothetical protein